MTRPRSGALWQVPPGSLKLSGGALTMRPLRAILKGKDVPLAMIDANGGGAGVRLGEGQDQEMRAEAHVGLAGIVWALAILAGSNRLEANTRFASELLSACEVLLLSARDQNGSLLHALTPEGGECLGFFNAAEQMLPFAEIPGYDSTYCLPENARRLQAIRVFVQYALSHPELLHLRSTLVLIEAFKSAFPCQTE